MTTQAQARATYEAMGVKPWDSASWSPFTPEDKTITTYPIIDHNFLAVAREQLLVTSSLKTDYLRFLFAGDFSFYRLTFASPAQQLTALVKAIGKWEETEK